MKKCFSGLWQGISGNISTLLKVEGEVVYINFVYDCLSSMKTSRINLNFCVSCKFGLELRIFFELTILQKLDCTSMQIFCYFQSCCHHGNENMSKELIKVLAFWYWQKCFSTLVLNLLSSFYMWLNQEKELKEHCLG